MLAKVEARLVPPRRKCLSAIIDDIDDEATVKKKKEKALAEHVARPVRRPDRDHLVVEVKVDEGGNLVGGRARRSARPRSPAPA
jgi:hypothetical protein